MAKQITGTIISKPGDKTVTVGVEVMKIHPRYKKRYTRVTKYHVHDAKNTFEVGDLVTIVETRPISKTKKWIIVDKT